MEDEERWEIRAKGKKNKKQKEQEKKNHYGENKIYNNKLCNVFICKPSFTPARCLKMRRKPNNNVHKSCCDQVKKKYHSGQKYVHKNLILLPYSNLATFDSESTNMMLKLTDSTPS